VTAFALPDAPGVVTGTLNRNAHAARENREVAVVLSGEQVADYYGRVFARNWRGEGGDGGTERVPVGALVALLAGVVVVALARRFEFER